MKIAKVISPRGCANGACPGILLAENGMILIQGTKVADRKGLKIPADEDVVGIPRSFFDALVREYTKQTAVASGPKVDTLVQAISGLQRYSVSRSR